jgi:FAD-linked oxidoreductase
MSMYRRDLLRGMIAAIVTTAVPTTLNAQAALPWRNWSGNQQCNPASRFAPQTISELQEWLKSSSSPLRAVGSGHSFSPLVPTSDVLLSTNYLQGVQAVSDDPLKADILAGTPLNRIGPALNEMNQALSNMPDIDRQTLAGAISTATHGTGRELFCLSAYVDELELLTPSGDILICNEVNNKALFDAARVGLGCMGIITRIRMRNEQPFRLQREARWHSYEEGMSVAEDMSKQNRNFEFYVIPFTGMILSDALNKTELAPNRNEELDGNDGLMDLKLARDYLGWSNKVRELVLGSYMSTLKTETNVDHSYQIYATERNVRFNEMEYHLPRKTGLKALDEVKQIIEAKFPEVFFPFECRFVKADDCWLSPFYKRDSISIAVHRYFEEDHRPLFAAIEPIFKKYGGRPHWGKINSHTQNDFRASYEMWDQFAKLRSEIDPQNRLLNPYLQKLFSV